MLIASKTRYVPVAVNMMTLQGEDGTYYYVHRSLYDRCIALRDTYHSIPKSLYISLGLKAEHPAVCDKFMESMPEPLDILGPYLALIADVDQLESIEDMCGALSVMSMQIDFRKMLKFPAELRSSIKFSLRIKEEYAVEWDRFFQETPTYESIYSSPKSVSLQEALADEEDSDTIYLDEITGDGFGDYSAFMPKEDQEEEEEEEEAEEEEAEATASGFDLLRRLS